MVSQENNLCCFLLVESRVHDGGDLFCSTDDSFTHCSPFSTNPDVTLDVGQTSRNQEEIETLESRYVITPRR